MFAAMLGLLAAALIGAGTPTASPPVVSITEPTAKERFVTPLPEISLAGTVTSGTTIERVSWRNSRGGRGAAVGTDRWTASRIWLARGENVVTIVAYDAEGNAGTDAIMVVREGEIPTDLDPPEITLLEPSPGARDVGPSQPILIRLEDVSGVDWPSVRITVGGETYAGDSPHVRRTDNTILWTPPVAYGSGVSVRAFVRARDLLGNEKRFEWWFSARKEPAIARSLPSGGAVYRRESPGDEIPDRMVRGRSVNDYWSVVVERIPGGELDELMRFLDAGLAAGDYGVAVRTGNRNLVEFGEYKQACYNRSTKLWGLLSTLCAGVALLSLAADPGSETAPGAFTLATGVGTAVGFGVVTIVNASLRFKWQGMTESFAPDAKRDGSTSAGDEPTTPTTDDSEDGWTQ